MNYLIIHVIVAFFFILFIFWDGKRTNYTTIQKLLWVLPAILLTIPTIIIYICVTYKPKDIVKNLSEREAPIDISVNHFSRMKFLSEIIILFLQFGLFYQTWWTMAAIKVSGDGSGVLLLIPIHAFLSLIIGGIGLIVAVPAFKKKINYYFSFLLLVTSLFTIFIYPQYYVGKYVSPFLEPFAATSQQKITYERNKSYEEAQRVHYDFLVNRFKVPQKVIGFTHGTDTLEGHNIIVLEGGYVVDSLLLQAHYYPSPTQITRDYYKYIRETLINKEVTIVLPPFTTQINATSAISGFNLDYVPDTQHGNANILESDPKDPELGVYFGTIPAQIYFDGELVSYSTWYGKYTKTN